MNELNKGWSVFDITLLPSKVLLKDDKTVPSGPTNLIDPEEIYKCCQGADCVPKSFVIAPGIILPVTIWLPI